MVMLLSNTASLGISLSWDEGSSFTSEKVASFTNRYTHSLAEAIYGGESDDWGRSWTPDELSDKNFMAQLNVADIIDPLAAGVEACADMVEIEVFYETEIVNLGTVKQSQKIILTG